MVITRTRRAAVVLGAAALAVGAGLVVVDASAQPAGPSTAAGGFGASSAEPAGWGMPGYDPFGLPGWGSSSGTGSSLGGSSSGAGGSSALETLSATASQAVEKVTPSVVNIDTVLGYGAGEAAGTGIVMSSDGIVLTNHHVVEGATSITATVVGTGRTYRASVVGYDPVSDIAVIDLAGASGLPVATLGNSDSVDLGELVVGVGNAGGVGGYPTSVEGVVTGLDQTITASDAAGGDSETLTGLIETDADIQAGQSGGPLVDASGEVVGVDVAASSSNGSGDTSGYAIPIDSAVAVAKQIVSGQGSATVHVGGSAFLGVQLGYAATDYVAGGPAAGGRAGFVGQGGSYAYGTTGRGVVVSGVVEGSAAAAAGLVPGDLITAVDGTSVSSAEQLSALISGHSVGDTMTITWVDSAGSSHQATVTLGEGPVG